MRAASIAIEYERPRLAVAAQITNNDLATRHDLGDGPEPSHVWRRAGRGVFVDATDDLAVGENVVVLVLPLAGGAGEFGAFESEAGHNLIGDCDEIRRFLPTNAGAMNG